MSSLNFLIGFCVCFIYLILVIKLSFKIEHISIYNRVKFNQARIAQLCLWVTPFFIGYIWSLLIKQEDSLNFLITGLFLCFILFGYEYYFFQPKLNSLIDAASKLYQDLKLDHSIETHKFIASSDQQILNRDFLVYRRGGHLIELKLDRICKNVYGRYFWIQASASNTYETKISLLDLEQARNLIRTDKETYLKEFNEAPYNN